MTTTDSQPLIEVLVSTCNAGLLSAARVPDAPQAGVRYLICHQLFGDVDEHRLGDTVAHLQARSDIRLLQMRARGLAANRNQCLNHARGDILLFADDDVALEPGWPALLRRHFAQYPRAAGLTFKVKTPAGEPFKRYAAQPFRHHWRSAMRVSSVELAVRREAIERAGLRFDERFGLGADYVACEENIFLSDALHRGLVLRYVPEYLLVHPAESSGQQMTSPSLVASKGAFFKRVFGWKGSVLLLAFALKKWPAYRSAMSPWRFVRLAFSTFGKV